MSYGKWLHGEHLGPGRKSGAGAPKEAGEQPEAEHPGFLACALILIAVGILLYWLVNGGLW